MSSDEAMLGAVREVKKLPIEARGKEAAKIMLDENIPGPAKELVFAVLRDPERVEAVLIKRISEASD